MDSRIVILFFGRTPLLSKVIMCSNYSRFGPWKYLQAGSCVLYAMPPLLWALFLFFCTSNARSSCCTLLALYLESAISSKSPGFFQWRMVFRSQDLSPIGAHCYRSVLRSLFLTNSDQLTDAFGKSTSSSPNSLITIGSNHTAIVDSPSHQPVQIAYSRVILNHLAS